MLHVIAVLLGVPAEASPEIDLTRDQRARITEHRASPSETTLRRLEEALGATSDACAERSATEPITPCSASVALAEAAYGPKSQLVLLHLVHLGQAQFTRADYGAAETVFRRALAMTQDLYGPTSLSAAAPTRSLGVTIAAQGRFDEAQALYDDALQIARAQLDDDDPRLAIYVAALGNLALQRQDDAAAEPWLREALEIVQKAHGPNHPESARFLNDLAVTLNGLGRYEESVDHALRAVVMTEATRPDDPQLATRLATLASSYYHSARYAESEATFERAIAVAERRLGPDHLTTARHLASYAVVLTELERLDEAEALHRRSLAIRESVLGADHPNLVAGIGSLATVRRELGDLAGAEALTRRALDLVQKTGGNPSQVGWLETNLGAMLNEQNRLAEAEGAYRRAVSALQEAYGESHPDLAVAMSHLARLIGEGHAAEAIELQQRAVAMAEAIHGPAHPSVGAQHATLARLFARAGRLDDADESFARALVIEESAFGPDHPDVGRTLSGLARLRQMQGRSEEAIELHERAVDIARAARGPHHLQTANRLGLLGHALLDQGRVREARRVFLRQLKALEKGYGPMFPPIVPTLDQLAHAEARLGRSRRTQEHLVRAFAVEANVLDTNLFAASQAQRAERLEAGRMRTDLAVRNAVDGLADALDLAFTSVVGRKARLRDLQHDVLALVRARQDAEGLALVEELLRVTRTVSAAYTTGDALDEVAPLRQRLVELERELVSRSVRFRELREPVSATSIAATLPAGGVLVEYVVYQRLARDGARSRSLAAFVLRADGTLSARDLGDAAAIESAVARLRTAIGSRTPAGPAADALSAQVVDPLPLAGATELFVAPDGPLSLVPFELLLDPDGPLVSYHTTGRERVGGLVAGPAPGPALVVYDVDYGAVDPSANRPLWRALPSTRTEGEAIEQVLAGATSLVGRAATEEAVIRASRPMVVHIASHGFFHGTSGAGADVRGLDAIPGTADDVTSLPLVRSGIVLAGANQPAEGIDDGLLTAAEVATWDLRGTRLATLSACQSGAGELRDGDGVHGLRRALALAGAQASVLSLWDVEDRATAVLMAELYAAMKRGAPLGEALATAKAVVRQNPEWQHPFFWATFTAAGDTSVRLPL